MTSARIRPALAAEAPAIHELHCRARRQAFTGQVPEELFVAEEREGLARWQEALSEGSHRTVWVAQRGEEIVGLARVRACGVEGPAPLELESLYVDSTEYGCGTGANLVQLSIGDAPCSLWILDGNERALRFYRKHGFDFDGQKRTVDGWPELTLRQMLRGN